MSIIEHVSVSSYNLTPISSEKDSIINSLLKNLNIHKELLEKCQHDKKKSLYQLKKERKRQEKALKKQKSEIINYLETKEHQCKRLQKSVDNLRQEIEQEKKAYLQLENNFYSYVKTIRATKDNLSAVKVKMIYLFDQLSSTCMEMKLEMDCKKGSEFVYQTFFGKTDLIEHYMSPSDGLLDASYITLFVEKYLAQIFEMLITSFPIHLGVSINDAFQKVQFWISKRNGQWSDRLRQQICVLVMKPDRLQEAEYITICKDSLLKNIRLVLGDIYPSLKHGSGKFESLIVNLIKLDLVLKGQSIAIKRISIIEEVTRLDASIMKTIEKGKSDGIVGLSITSAFAISSIQDQEHTFTIPAKVLCI
ncbi:hypothetical protein BY458DRAFT_431006 [Sporodiniella umbellata]|nr:hypothetical protein BY458DRAFT_431006 [Sporodiniella umbellata]